jgi:transcriptional regulator GlxA family with amidase domain
MRRMRTEILLYDGFDELDGLGPFEVLRTAGLEAELVSVDGPANITGSHGAVIRTARALGDPDLVIVPGGGWNTRSGVGAWGEAQKGTIPAALADRHAAGGRIASVCTGGMLLATAGILRGRPAVTHHSALGDLAESGAQVIDARVVDDGDVLTAGGVMSGIDLALHLVERELGAEAADKVAREIEHDRRGTVYSAPVSG